MLKQVLPNSAQQNILSPVRRICIMMLGPKGLTRATFADTYWSNLSDLNSGT